MNNQRIIDWVDGLFTSFAQADIVREQKEELQTHLAEKVHEYMLFERMEFDDAFAKAKDGLGDLDELMANFQKSDGIKANATASGVGVIVGDKIYGHHFHDNRSNDPQLDGMSSDVHFFDERPKKKWRFRIQCEGLVALTPFIYLILGFAFGWWAWGWIIIPVSAILLSWDDRDAESIGHRIVALSPFAYLVLGFTLGWWAWGWIIIPASAVIFSSGLIRFARE